jgi:hypothetical protein
LFSVVVLFALSNCVPLWTRARHRTRTNDKFGVRKKTLGPQGPSRQKLAGDGHRDHLTFIEPERQS